MAANLNYAAVFKDDKDTLDPYGRQINALKGESKGGVNTFLDAVYKSVTGKARWSQAMKVEPVGANTKVIDTALGRYMVSTDGDGNPTKATLLMTEPPQDKQRYAIVGYTQERDGTVTQHYAKINEDRYESSAPILPTLSMPGKILVQDKIYLGKKPQGNAVVKRKGKRNLDD